MNERIAMLHARALRSRMVPDEGAAAVWRDAAAHAVPEPAVLRDAEAFAYYCRHREILIHEGELLVGSEPSLVYDAGDETTPTIFGRRSWQCFWPVPEEVNRLFQEGLLDCAGNHTTLDYDTVLTLGFRGLIARIDERIARLGPGDADAGAKRDFLRGLRIVAEGYIDLCVRYADLAQEMATKTEDEMRSRELRIISAICRRVIAEPPTNFWEACQAAWFAFFFLPDAPGRVDQYLYPYYREWFDPAIERCVMPPDFARELLSCLWIKYFERAGAQSGVSALQHLTLGGVKPDGSDASNELTRLCLDVTEDLRLNRPQVGLRWNRNTPPDLLQRAVRVLRTHSGNPDFCNDEQIVPALARTGIAIEDARDFSLSGCHEVIVTGKAQMGSVEGFINLPKILRLTLGLEPALGPGAGLAGIDSFEALWSALEEAMESIAVATHEASLARDRQAAEIPGGNLAASLVVADCIENARGYTQGGARYNHCNWDIIGLANLADSLACIRKLVFEERAMALPELAEVMRADWEGHEALRLRILHQFPHFGNDDESVDSLAIRVIERFATIMQRRRPFRGGQYILGTLAGGENMHVEFGRVTGATPDGRRAGETLSDSMGPAQGRDRQGITAMLASVARLPHALLPTASTLNVKLDPRLLADDEGIGKLAALIRGHFLAGGQQCQLNLVNREMLLDARRHPEQHRHLIVRVAGYSAPFTSLWDDLQDEIIARTEHSV